MPPRRARDPLAALAARRQISPTEFQAALALRRARNRGAIEAAILAQCGELGLETVTAVILDGGALADLADNAPERRVYGWLLRRALGAAARRLGYSATRS